MKTGKIKVVRIISRLNIGGPAIHAVLLTDGLPAGSFESYLVAGKPDPDEGDMSYLADNKGLTFKYIPELRREIGFSDFSAFMKIFFYIRKIKPTIVHTHTAKAGTLGRLAAVFAGVPIRIHTFHGHVFDGYFTPLKARLFLWIERFLAFFTQKVVVVSESVRDEIVNKLKVAGRSKCSIVPLGFELEKFLECETVKGLFRKDLRVNDDVLLIGIVGRLVPIKHHTLFLDAVRKILDKKLAVKTRFVIVGDGELRIYLEKYAKERGVDNAVIFTGWKRDLAKVYADLDVVMLTSLNEGTPVSLIEAMASARPIIATDVGGVRDIVRHNENAFLVESGDAAALADRAEELLLDDAKRMSLGRRGREIVREKYSKERLIRDIEGLYKQCVFGKGTGIAGG